MSPPRSAARQVLPGRAARVQLADRRPASRRPPASAAGGRVALRRAASAGRRARRRLATWHDRRCPRAGVRRAGSPSAVNSVICVSSVIAPGGRRRGARSAMPRGPKRAADLRQRVELDAGAERVADGAAEQAAGDARRVLGRRRRAASGARAPPARWSRWPPGRARAHRGDRLARRPCRAPPAAAPRSSPCARGRPCSAAPRCAPRRSRWRTHAPALFQRSSNAASGTLASTIGRCNQSTPRRAALRRHSGRGRRTAPRARPLDQRHQRRRRPSRRWRRGRARGHAPRRRWRRAAGTCRDRR